MYNHSVDRIVLPNFPEKYMEERENIELGRELIADLRTSDSPLVVQLEVKKYRGIETPPLNHVRTSLKITKAKSMDVTLYREPYLVSETPKREMSPVLVGAGLILFAMLVTGFVYWVLSIVAK